MTSQPETKRPIAAGDVRTIVLNGSKLTERYDGTQWVVVKVEPTSR
ncbi:hypothetical protein ACQVRV_00110 (plasmid) [Ralstonia pseudosolanacearum]